MSFASNCRDEHIKFSPRPAIEVRTKQLFDELADELASGAPGAPHEPERRRLSCKLA